MAVPSLVVVFGHPPSSPSSTAARRILVHTDCHHTGLIVACLPVSPVAAVVVVCPPFHRCRSGGPIARVIIVGRRPPSPSSSPPPAAIVTPPSPHSLSVADIAISNIVGTGWGYRYPRIPNPGWQSLYCDRPLILKVYYHSEILRCADLAKIF
jgi:hypothetical protein